LTRLLLHACCAPCSLKCAESLRAEGITPELFFYNPNIHPFTEYRERLQTLSEFCKAEALPLHIGGGYGLREFLPATKDAQSAPDRCSVCYGMRLNETARFARENGFTAFSTTLFISPYQNHGLLIEAANSAAKKYGAELLYRDFRPLFRGGQTAARERGFYMQKYCGCVFSEEERYDKKNPL
jgi:predicted adenine nucleotide alpha hydrolase (AANH) superfamily ATPase